MALWSNGLYARYQAPRGVRPGGPTRPGGVIISTYQVDWRRSIAVCTRAMIIGRGRVLFSGLRRSSGRAPSTTTRCVTARPIRYRGGGEAAHQY